MFCIIGSVLLLFGVFFFFPILVGVVLLALCLPNKHPLNRKLKHWAYGSKTPFKR